MADVTVGARPSPLRPWIILAAALAGITAIVPTAQHLYGAALARPSIAALDPANIEGLFTVALAVALCLVAALGLRMDGRGGGLAGRAPMAMAPAGAGLGLFGLLAAAALASVAAPMQAGHAGGGALIVGTAAVLLQSAAEEVYFRGWLQPALVRHWGPLPGLAAAAAAFAALHMLGGERSAISLFNLFLGGILFGLLALRTAGLAAPIGAHFAWNWAEQILLGLDPNPGTGSFGAIFDLDLVGASLWGGSDEGLNASLAVLFVLVALIVPVAMWRPAWRA